MRSKLVSIGSAALMLAVMAPSAFAQDGSTDGRALVLCNGGIQEAIFTRSQNAGASTTIRILLALKQG